jgi:hypothetical protein
MDPVKPVEQIEQLHPHVQHWLAVRRALFDVLDTESDPAIVTRTW